MCTRDSFLTWSFRKTTTAKAAPGDEASYGVDPPSPLLRFGRDEGQAGCDGFELSAGLDRDRAEAAQKQGADGGDEG